MTENNKIVIDTNILVSAILFPSSLLAKAVDKAFIYYEPYASEATVNEFLEVIQRTKFDKYFANKPYSKEFFIEHFLKSVTVIEPTVQVTDCPDPKDNKFLEIALSANARLLVTGDHKHLISMNPYHGLLIITAKDFLENY